MAKAAAISVLPKFSLLLLARLRCHRSGQPLAIAKLSASVQSGDIQQRDRPLEHAAARTFCSLGHLHSRKRSVEPSENLDGHWPTTVSWGSIILKVASDSGFVLCKQNVYRPTGPRKSDTSAGGVSESKIGHDIFVLDSGHTASVWD